jgi:NADP-dependent 3-hydroxy acid dehydrogenase YdfG
VSPNRDSPERVLITGASGGIGMATAEAFGSRGASVALLARGLEGLERSANAVSQAGGNPVVVTADVTDREALDRAVGEAALQMGGMDVAVVNAAAATYGPFAATDPDEFDRCIEVTLNGAVNTIRSVMPHLEKTGGTLVVVGSAAGKMPLPMLSSYTAAKHGLRAFVDVMRIEERSRDSDVTVSYVSPGPVDTPFWENVATQEGRLPPHLPGAYRPEEVANAIVLVVDRGVAGMTVGGLTLAAELVHGTLTPITERVLSAFMSWVRDRGEEGEGRRAIERPTGTGQTDGPLTGRPSVLVRAGGALTGVVSLLARR